MAGRGQWRKNITTKKVKNKKTKKNSGAKAKKNSGNKKNSGAKSKKNSGAKKSTNTVSKPKNEHRASATTRTQTKKSTSGIKSNVVVKKTEPKTKTNVRTTTPTTHRSTAAKKVTTTTSTRREGAEKAGKTARAGVKAARHQFGLEKGAFKVTTAKDGTQGVDALHVGTNATAKTDISKKDQKKAGNQYVKDFFGKDGKSGEGWQEYKADMKKTNRQNAREAYREWYKDTYGKDATKAEVKEWMNSEEGKQYRRENYYAAKRGWYKDENGNKVYLTDENGKKVGSARENIEKALRKQAKEDNPTKVKGGRMSVGEREMLNNMERAGMSQKRINEALKKSTGLDAFYDVNGKRVTNTYVNNKGNVVYKDENGKVHRARNKQGKISTQKTIGQRVLEEATKQKVYGYTKGQSFGTGLLEGSMGMIPITLSNLGAGDYSTADKNVIAKGESSKAYEIGNMVGLMASMVGSGAGGIEDAVAQRFIRNASKKALLKQGIKATDDDIVKALAKLKKGEIQSSAITDAVGSVGRGRKYAANAAGGVISTAPLDVADAVRTSTDTEGNINPAAFGMSMLANVGLGGAMSAGMKGVGDAVASAQGRSFSRLGKTAEDYATIGKEMPVELQSKAVDKVAKLEGKDIYSPSYNAAQKYLGKESDALAKNVDSYKAGADMKYSSAEIAKATRNLRAKQASGTISKDERKLLQKLNTDSMATALSKTDAKELARLTTTKNVRELTESEATRLTDLQRKADKSLRNKERYANVTSAVDSMTEKTGTTYKVVNDAEMRDLVRKSGETVTDDEYYRGFYYKNDKGETEILINADAPQAHQTIIGHETGHLLKSADEEGFKALSTMLKDYARENGELDALVNEIKRSYPEAADEGIDEEVACELLGRYIYGNDDAFIKSLANENPTVFQRIINYFKELLGKTEDKEISKELQAIVDKHNELMKKADGAKAEEGKMTNDSAGNNLSEGQQKFYKNSKAVDKNGNLQVYYHGTGDEFDTFDLGRAGQNYEGWSENGKGIYLTTKKKDAKYWSEKSRGNGYYVKELYANLEKPFNTRKISSEEVSSLFPNLVAKFKQNGIDNIEDILWMQKSRAEDGELDGGVFLDSFGAVEKENNGVTPFTARDFLEEQGYDGIMDYDVVVVFDNNKVKYTSNLNPTSSADLRFSKQKKTFESGGYSPYNNIGGKNNGKDINTGRIEDVRRTSGTVQGRQETPESNTALNETGQKSYGVSKNARNVLSDTQIAEFNSAGVPYKHVRDITKDPDNFVGNLKRNADSQDYGACVDTDYSHEDLKDAKLYYIKNGEATIGVKPDGDIFGLSKLKGSDAKISEGLYVAIANGGIKMDDYGSHLADLYAGYGFEPVARVKYSEDVIRKFNPPEEAERKIAVFNDMKENGIEPDVYVFMHNGDDLKTIKNTDYSEWDDEALSKLKTFDSDGYMDALEYRDKLISGEIEKPATDAGSFNAKPQKTEVDKTTGISTKSVSEMTDEELNKEARSLGARIKNGKTPERQKARRERLAEINAELKSRGKGNSYDDSIYTARAGADLRQKTKKAMEYGIDVNARVSEFNELGAKVDTLKKQIKSAKDEKERLKLEQDMEDAEIRQTQIAKSIYQDLADARIKKAGGKEFTPKDFDKVTKDETKGAINEIGGIDSVSSEIKKVGNKVGSKKAQKLVAEEMKDYKSCIDNYINGSSAKEADMQNARASALLDNISERLKANPDDAEAMSDLMRVTEKLSEDSTLPSNVINKANTVLSATPKGRIGVAKRAAEDLNKRYGDRIDGVLDLTEDETRRLAVTDAGEDLDKLYEEITYRLWDNIPATRMEKFNEIRHMFMLANARTHARNFGGNTVFRGFRKVADDLEAFMQDKVFREAIEKRGGEVDRVRVTGKDINPHKEYLSSEFEEAYAKRKSTNRWIETDRPDGVPVVKVKALNALIQGDYKALEWEDMLTFKPAFNKSYVQYVKAKGWDINSLTPAQKEMARDRALFDAEYATFRDTSRFSTWLTGKKHLLAGKQGKTIWGTAFYRMGNAALEGLMPFVKTPVNIFRRSVDFSPISLIRSMGELASKDADVFKQGIKHLATGLTGTGVFGLGVFLADNDVVSIDTKNGSHSGSKYYDQELGYQDYSLVINIGGKKQSWTIDWLQPIEASLFMGAAFKDMLKDIKTGEEVGTDAIAALFAVTSPMLDSSFMSSTKDMFTTFEQRASNENDNGEPDMATAFAQMILADLPKNYISSVVPQIVSQVANVTDKYQRDTQSTLKDPVFASWDKAGKQMINRMPVLRQLLLNPKLDRRGKDKENNSNVAIRIINAMINPSNVKDINENKYDRELFKIRNDMKNKNSDDYKNFFYNFTGNPSYELANGKRMTYDEAYDYGKTSRTKQWNMVKGMIDSDTYKFMTNEMKASEVDDTHWVATAKADYKTYGANYAIKALKSNEKTWDKESKTYNEYKASTSKDRSARNETYIKYYIQKETMYTRGHPEGTDGYVIKGLAAKMYGDNDLYDALDIYDSKTKAINKYLRSVRKEVKKNGGKVTDIVKKEVTNWCSGVTSMLKKADVDHSTVRSSLAAACLQQKGLKQSERVYRCMGHDWNSAQAGGGLILKYGINGKKGVDAIRELDNVKREIKRNYDVDGSGTVTKQDVVAYIDSLNLKSADEKACLFQTLSTANNPYASTIKDHLEWGDNTDEYSSGSGGGWGYGGWGSGGGGGSAGGTTLKATKNKAIKKASKLSIDTPAPVSSGTAPTAPKFSVTAQTSTSNHSSKSNLDDAYRKRLQKLLKG